MVVVNFNGGDLTLACLRALQATDWPADLLDLVLVDNGSIDRVVATVTQDMPDVRVIAAGGNLGFAAGCNLAMRDRQGVDFVALVNNDAIVEPGWLMAMVDAMGTDERVGAVNPKVLLAAQFHQLVIGPAGPGPALGSRSAKVRLHDIRGDEVDLWLAVEFADGFSEAQYLGRAAEHYREVGGSGRLLVPSGHIGDSGSLRLRLSARSAAQVTISGGATPQTVTLDARPTWVTVEVGSDLVDIVNSAGGAITASGQGCDRGFLEPATGAYDEGAEIETWTGSVVLLSSRYLDDVGLFDERFFLYYEDFDLAWRGRKNGWRYLYTPSTTARHVRGASSERGTRLLAVLNQRNRLLTILKNARAVDAVSAIGRDLLATASYCWRDTGRRIMSGERPNLRVVRERLAGHASLLVAAPRTVVSRRRTSRARRAGSREPESMLP